MMWLLTLALIFLLPFFAPQLFKATTIFLYGALSVLLLYFSARAKKAKKRFENRFLLFPLLVFFIIIVAASASSKHPAAALENALYFSFYAVIFAAITALDSRKKKEIALAIIAGSFFVSLLALAQRFFYFDRIISYMVAHRSLFSEKEFSYVMDIASQKRSVATFSTPNLLASYLAMINVAILGFLFAKKGKWGGIVLAALSAVNLSALWFTRSFAGFASFIFGVSLFTALVFIKDKERFKSRGRRFIPIAALILSLFAILFITRYFYGDGAHKLSLAMAGRLEFWKGAFGAISDKPFSFAGAGNFGYIYRIYAPSGAARTTMAHNLLLQLWVEAGLYGLLAFIWFASALIYKAVKNIIRPETPFDAALPRIGLLSGVSAFLFHNMACFSFFIPQTAIIWWILCGLLVYPTNPASPTCEVGH